VRAVDQGQDALAGEPADDVAAERHVVDQALDISWSTTCAHAPLLFRDCWMTHSSKPTRP
jgi:hypothetical protein